MTKAFQQVPPGSANHRSVPLPTVTSTPASYHQQSVPLPPPQAPPGALRPMYTGYSSPLMASPSPSMYSVPMASSPVPRPMMVNGAPQYAPPMWYPVQGAPPPPVGGMMRSPYPSHLMPSYTVPGSNMPMYAPHHPPPGSLPPQPNGMHHRPGGLHVASPVAPHAHAVPSMYASSPVLMHTPASAIPPPPGYANASSHHRGQPPPHQSHRGVYDNVPGMMPYSPSLHSQPQVSYSASHGHNTLDSRPPW